MTTKQIEQLLELIDAAVLENAPFAQKRDQILGQCNDDMKIALGEFVSWFDDDED